MYSGLQDSAVERTGIFRPTGCSSLCRESNSPTVCTRSQLASINDNVSWCLNWQLSHRDLNTKMLAVNISANHMMFTSAHRHHTVVSTKHHYLTLVLAAGGDGCGVAGNKLLNSMVAELVEIKKKTEQKKRVNVGLPV